MSLFFFNGRNADKYTRCFDWGFYCVCVDLCALDAVKTTSKNALPAVKPRAINERAAEKKAHTKHTYKSENTTHQEYRAARPQRQPLRRSGGRRGRHCLQCRCRLSAVSPPVFTANCPSKASLHTFRL